MVNDDILFKRYISCYEQIARDDLEEEIDTAKDIRHAELLDFIRDLNHGSIIDIGSSQGLFLQRINADKKIAFDISMTYLKKISRDLNPIRGNAEKLPFRNHVFDSIILSDIMEHVLLPDAVIAECSRILKQSGNLYLAIPWKEDLSSYKIYEGKYEFTHLRAFNDENIRDMTSQYFIIEEMKRSSIGRYKNFLNSEILNYFIYGATPLRFNFWRRLILGPAHMMIRLRKK